MSHRGRGAQPQRPRSPKRVVVARREWKRGPFALRLIFRRWFGQEFDEPFAAAGRIEANSGELIGGGVSSSGFAEFAFAVGRPSGGDQFFGHFFSFLHRGDVGRENTIDVFGANGADVIAAKEPVTGGQTANDNNIGMHFLRNGGGDCHQDVAQADFHGLGRHGVEGRACCSALRN